MEKEEADEEYLKAGEWVCSHVSDHAGVHYYECTIAKVFLNCRIMPDVFADGKVMKRTKFTNAMGTLLGIKLRCENQSLTLKLSLIVKPPPGNLSDFLF